MRTRDYLSLVSRNLRKRKGRVALTANGVLIGTAAVVMLVSLGIGMQHGVMAQFEKIGDLHSIWVSPASSQANANESPDQRNSRASRSGIDQPLDRQALEAIRSLPGVVTVIPQVIPSGYVEGSLGELKTTANLVGLDVQDLAGLGFEVEVGTTKLSRGTVILGDLALNSFGEPYELSGGGGINYIRLEAIDLLGQKLRFQVYKEKGEQTKIVELRIGGVLADGSSDRNIYLRSEDVTAWNEFYLGRHIRRSKEGHDQLIVEVESIPQVERVADQIETLGFETVTQTALIERVNQTYLLIELLLGVTGMVSLLMAGVGIANTMIAATLEQTSEIGLWKAVGASNREIMILVLGQSVGVGLIGGVGGALTGWVGARLFNLLGGLNVNVQVFGQSASQVVLAHTPLWLLFLTPGFALMIGLIAGLFPAMHAATLPPVEALKYE